MSAVSYTDIKCYILKVKDLYETTKKNVTEVESKTVDGAVDTPLLLSRAFLEGLAKEVDVNEARYLEAIAGEHPDVVFVPTHTQVPVITLKPSGSKPIPVATKRKAASPAADGE